MDRDPERLAAGSIQAMIKRFEESTPSEFKDLVREEETPTGKSAGTVPLSMDSAIPPSRERALFQEFATSAFQPGILIPARARAIVDVMSEKDKFKILLSCLCG